MDVELDVNALTAGWAKVAPVRVPTERERTPEQQFFDTKIEDAYSAWVGDGKPKEYGDARHARTIEAKSLREIEEVKRRLRLSAVRLKRGLSFVSTEQISSRCWRVTFTVQEKKIYRPRRKRGEDGELVDQELPTQERARTLEPQSQEGAWLDPERGPGREELRPRKQAQRPALALSPGSTMPLFEEGQGLV